MGLLLAVSRRIRSAMALRRQPAAIVLGEYRADQPAETLGLLVVQIAGPAERMAAGIDELLQCVSALWGITDHGDPDACASITP